jgi:hypothetical protein
MLWPWSLGTPPLPPLTFVIEADNTAESQEDTLGRLGSNLQQFAGGRASG